MKKKRFKYPKIFLFIITIILAYFIFQGRNFEPFNQIIISLGLIGIFLTGILYTYSFTAVPATALLLILASNHSIATASIIGGIGALVGDLLIFKFIKHSFTDEIEHLQKESVYIKTFRILPKLVKKYILPVLAIIVIASPLPDELGVSLLAFYKKMPLYVFITLSYIFNTLGILIILLIGKSI